MFNLEYTRRKKTNERERTKHKHKHTIQSREREELREKEILPKKQSNAATRFSKNEIEYIYFLFSVCSYMLLLCTRIFFK
jgi:hypothetical protein